MHRSVLWEWHIVRGIALSTSEEIGIGLFLRLDVEDVWRYLEKNIENLPVHPSININKVTFPIIYFTIPCCILVFVCRLPLSEVVSLALKHFGIG